MPSADEVYIHCDELNKIPKQNRDNWIYENELLIGELPKSAKVLQVGCMDGTRIISLLRKRPDLNITGLEIEEDILKIAKDKLNKVNVKADLVLGDITKALHLSNFDFVICLNNTLGYIQDQELAIKNMKTIGKTVIVSVYGEKFTDRLARAYFKSINLQIESIEGNIFHMKGFVDVKRYTIDEIQKWDCKIIRTPLGYFCILKTEEN